MMNSWYSGLRGCPFENLLWLISTGLYRNGSGAAYSADRINDRGLTACGNVHLVVHLSGLRRSGGARPVQCAFINLGGRLLASVIA